jgi:hypothetical protein
MERYCPYLLLIRKALLDNEECNNFTSEMMPGPSWCDARLRRKQTVNRLGYAGGIISYPLLHVLHSVIGRETSFCMI